MEKQCKKCGQIKDINEFAYRKDTNKYRNECKECTNSRVRKHPKKPIAKDGYKYCAKCNNELSLDCFNKRKINGKMNYFSYCISCERDMDNNRYNHICEECGNEYNSGRKDSKICKKCHTKIFKEIGKKTLMSINSNQRGENNRMYKVYRCGKDTPNYNPNKTDKEREYGRLVEGYTPWRKAVYEKDNYTCKCCDDNKGGNLVAHHLDGYNWCKDKRTDTNNGITLCNKCHKEFHNIYGFGNNTKEQFEEFLKNRNTESA